MKQLRRSGRAREATLRVTVTSSLCVCAVALGLSTAVRAQQSQDAGVDAGQASVADPEADGFRGDSELAEGVRLSGGACSLRGSDPVGLRTGRGHWFLLVLGLGLALRARHPLGVERAERRR